MTTGGQSDWFVPTRTEMQLAYDNATVIDVAVGAGLPYRTSTQGMPGTAALLRTDINYGNTSYGTASSNYVLPMRSF